MAAQDAAGQGVHTSDADYMADLASLGESTPAAPPAAPAPAAPAQPGYEPVAAADPYASHAQQEAYYGVQDAYAYQQQYAYYGQQPDPYYAQQAQLHQDQNQPHAGHPQDHQDMQGGQPQLDETSFFDTSMIDLDQVREYEARHGHGYGPGYGQGG
jgi:hypothetical protein